MTSLKMLHRLGRDQAGAALIEFVVVAVVFFSMMFAIIEYGMIMLTKIAIESATQQVSRSSGVNKSVGGCLDRACQVKKLVQDKTLGLISPQYVNITSRVVSAPTDASPPIPDTCLDVVGIPSPLTCTSFLNNDGVPGYQQPTPISVGSFGFGLMSRFVISVAENRNALIRENPVAPSHVIQRLLAPGGVRRAPKYA